MFVNNCPEQNSISSKIKGLYEPTRESNEGLVLICLKCNILQDVCVGGGAVSSQLRVAVSWEGFKKTFSW